MNVLGAKLELLLRQINIYKPNTYIEVGCFRCDTMKVVKNLGIPRVIGFDMFQPQSGPVTKHGVGEEGAPLDGDPLSYDEASALGFEVYEGNTRETLKMLSSMQLEPLVFVFIDGGHTYETVSSDYGLVVESIPDAVIVLDDITYPGVAQLVSEIPLDIKRWMGLQMLLIKPNG
jgi:hypothetical protein